MFLFDHNHPSWQVRYGRHNRTNGAQTYSEEIVRYQVPIWRSLTANAPGEVVVSTCGIVPSTCPPRPYLLVQYLHEYPIGEYEEWLKRRLDVINARTQPQHLVFVVAYRSFQSWLQNHGLNAIYVPMSIDPPVPKKIKRRGEGHVAYYGNLNVRRAVAARRQRLLQEIRGVLAARGWQLTVVSGVPQQEAWQQLNEFSYGIGVGRCAQEMSALGLRVMIAGQQFGGIITTPAELEVQRSTNLNGRVCTFDNDINICLQSLDLTLECHLDAKKALPVFDAAIRDYLRGL